MNNKKELNNPDMKEIFFDGGEGTAQKSTPDTAKAEKASAVEKTSDKEKVQKAEKSQKSEKASKEKKVKTKEVTKGKAVSVKSKPEKKGMFLLGAKKNAKPEKKATTEDPLDDLEFVDLMDDDALERLAEKGWEKDLAIASKGKPAGAGSQAKSVSGEVSIGKKEGKSDTAKTKLASGAAVASTKDNGTNRSEAKSLRGESAKNGAEVLTLTNQKKAKKVSKHNSAVKRGYTSFSHIRTSMVAIALLIMVLTGVVASRMLVLKQRTDVIASFAYVGADLADVNVIGSIGLTAVSDSQRETQAKELLAQKEQEEKEKEEQEEKDRIQVELVCQTIMGDLKIKFVNAETKHLITNVPFSVEVTGPDGKVTKYTNDDLDGIIYKSGIPAGDYTVKMLDIPKGDKYKKYVKAEKGSTVAVSDNINYKVVDVTDEVVQEAEAAGEQKVGNDIVEETVLQDTVAFVESSKTLISGGEKYNPIDSSQVLIPTSGQARGRIIGDFVFMSSRTPDSTTAVTDENAGDASSNASSASSSSSTSGESASSGASTQPETTEPAAPAKTFKAEISSAPSSMKAGESATISVTTNLNNATFNWFIADNPEAASVSGNGASASVTAIKEGTVMVQCQVAGQDDDGAQVETIPVSCTIKITQNQTQTEQKPDSSSGINPSQKITTKDNKTIYVADGSGKYIEATYGDYTAKKQLYVRSEETAVYKYTGWQSIDGQSYYYTADGQPVTGEQIIRGVKYTFAANGALSTNGTITGIDVSAHQGSIDWAAVKSAGVSFAIVRVGFRGYETGRLVEDSCFRRNLQGAINNGIRVGVYVFSSAINEVEAVEEASLAINLIRGYNITYPVYIDIESSGTGAGRADRIDVGTRTAVAKAFCQTVAAAGYKAGVYANTTWFNSYMNTPQLTNYSIWLAQYNTTVTYTRTKYDIWQYSSKGSIPGINTRVDMNIGYTSY